MKKEKTEKANRLTDKIIPQIVLQSIIIIFVALPYTIDVGGKNTLMTTH